MWLFITLGVIGVILGLYLLNRDVGIFIRPLDGIEIFFSIIITILVSGLISFILSVIFSICYLKWTDVEYEYKYEYLEIVNLQDNSLTSGSFFLGSGSINETPYYIYYYKTEDCFYKMGKTNANNAKIKITDGTPRKVIRKKFIVAKNFIERNFVVIPPKESKTVYFEVPPGSIKEIYNLDAKL